MKTIFTLLISVFSFGLTAGNSVSLHCKSTTANASDAFSVFSDHSKKIVKPHKKNRFSFGSFSKKKLNLKSTGKEKEKKVKKKDPCDDDECLDSCVYGGCALIYAGLTSGDAKLVALTIILTIVVVACVVVLAMG